MKLDNLVTTYEQSKRIKELGCKRETLYGYVDTRKSWKEYNRQFRYPGDEGIFVPFEGIYRPNDELELRLYEFGGEKHCNDAQPMPAYTAEELGEALTTQRKVRRHPTGIVASHFLSGDKQFIAPTLAQAMGDMLIYLLENNLLPTNETDG